MSTTAEKIIDIRKHCNMTQDVFALAIGVTQSAVSLYESGRRLPTIRVCYKIIGLGKAHGVKTSLESLIPEEDLIYDDRRTCAA